MLVYLLAGLIIIVVSKIFEQRYKVKSTYFKFKNYVSENTQSWEDMSDDIILRRDIHSLENIIGKADIYLIERTESEIKVCSLNNEKSKSMLEPQYQVIMKKFESQDMLYSFNIDTGSIYYHFNPPNENYVLWIYVH